MNLSTNNLFFTVSLFCSSFAAASESLRVENYCQLVDLCCGKNIRTLLEEKTVPACFPKKKTDKHQKIARQAIDIIADTVKL